MAVQEEGDAGKSRYLRFMILVIAGILAVQIHWSILLLVGWCGNGGRDHSLCLPSLGQWLCRCLASAVPDRHRRAAGY